MMHRDFDRLTNVTSGGGTPAEVPKTLLTTHEGAGDYILESESPERDFEASELSLEGVLTESEFKKVFEEILIAESYPTEVIYAQLDLVSKHIQKVRTNHVHLNNIPEKFGLRSTIACLVIKDAQSFEAMKALLGHITHITDGGRRYSGRDILGSLDLLLSKHTDAIVSMTNFPMAYGLRDKIKELIYNSPAPESAQSEGLVTTPYDEEGFDVPTQHTKEDTLPIPAAAETKPDSTGITKTLPTRSNILSPEQSTAEQPLVDQGETLRTWEESESRYRTLLENYTQDSEVLNSQLQWIQKSFYGEGRDLHQLEQIGDSTVREKVSRLLIKEARDFSELVTLLKHTDSLSSESGTQTKTEIIEILVNTIKGVPGFDISQLTNAQSFQRAVEQILLKEMRRPDFDTTQLLAQLETLER